MTCASPRRDSTDDKPDPGPILAICSVVLGSERGLSPFANRLRWLPQLDHALKLDLFASLVLKDYCEWGEGGALSLSSSSKKFHRVRPSATHPTFLQAAIFLGERKRRGN